MMTWEHEPPPLHPETPDTHECEGQDAPADGCDVPGVAFFDVKKRGDPQTRGQVIVPFSRCAGTIVETSWGETRYGLMTVTDDGRTLTTFVSESVFAAFMAARAEARG